MGVESTSRASSVMGSASVLAQFRRMVPGSKSGPVALVVSIAFSSRCVHLVRRSVNVGIAGCVSVC